MGGSSSTLERTNGSSLIRVASKSYGSRSCNFTTRPGLTFDSNEVHNFVAIFHEDGMQSMKREGEWDKSLLNV